MPYCTQCGTLCSDTDRYCGKCGTTQPGATGSGPRQSTAQAQATDYIKNVTPRNARLFCYIPVVGWIWSIVVLASAQFRHDATVRFHAFQGLYLFVAWLIVDMVVTPMFWPVPHGFGLRMIPQALKLVLMGAWVFMIVKTAHGENYRLPIIGELADRSVSEQR